MTKKEIIKFLMKMVNPEFKYDWDIVKWYFNFWFKFNITKKDWIKWKKENK